jgi:NADPH:quinone reductase
MNQGDDIAGVVHAVGSNITEFHPGDRVAAFHEMTTPGGSYAEYALAWGHTTFHIPKETSFEEAATLPLAAMTAAVGLYSSSQLALPVPWAPADKSIPLIVYGGASSVGAFVIQFARRTNLHPIIAVAGRGAQFVEGLIDKSNGDVVVDYRNGDEAVVKGINEALKGAKALHAFDAVSEKGSTANLGKVVADGGFITTVLPTNREDVPEKISLGITRVGSVHNDAKDLGFVFFRLIGRGLQEGWFKSHPYEVIPGGLQGIGKAMLNLKEGKASAIKYVFRIEETEGIEKSSL